jgi:hypothetical protein
MVRLLSAGAVCAAFLLFACGAQAQGAHGAGGRHARLQSTTFRLHDDGNPGRDATFWVAHGPLDGRFGIVRLHPAGSHTYAATVNLPVTGTTTFTFLAGTGSVMTRMGPAPGNPVVTISTFDGTTAEAASRHVVEWSAPIG